jgi:uncharacterized protein YcfJ
MTNRNRLTLAAALLGIAAGARAQNISQGTQFDIRTNERIDGRQAGSGRIYSAEVASDIRDTHGDVVIRRGANAELIVRRIARNEVAVDLDGIDVDGKHYSVPSSDVTLSQKAGVGSNSRTGKYVGGTALLGTILGAIAGGGKGAAIGALAGGAAGAGVQTLTRGKSINIPAESILTFRLDRNMTIIQDRGYRRGKRHYHPRDDR